MVAILLAGIAMNKQAKRRGSTPRRKVIRQKLFDDDYSTDDESMVCSTFSGTIAPTKKKPLRRLVTTAGSRLARRTRTHGLVGHAGCEGSVPVMDLPAAEAPMTGRQKRKSWMQAKLKAKEVQGGENSKEEEVGTEDDGLDPAAGLAKRREAKPDLKYLGLELVC